MENHATTIPKIDLNQADVETLAALPGIGPALAARIVRFREEVQPFEEAIEITAVPGISERMYRQFADRVTAPPSGETPADRTSPELPSPAPDSPAQTAAPPPPAGETATPSPGEAGAPGEAPLAIASAQSEATSQTAAPPQIGPEVKAAAEAQPGAAGARAEPASPKSKTEPPSPVATPPPPARFSWAGCVQSLLLVIVGIAGGAVLALLVLQGINGTLDLASDAQVRQLNDELAILEGRGETLTEEIGELRNRLNQFEALSGRLQNAEADLQALDEALTTVDEALSTINEELATLDQDTGQLQESVDQIQEATGRFDGFLAGLRELLLATENGTPLPAGTVTTPGSLTPTAAELIEATATITGSPIALPSPTATRTPRPTRTPTATPTVTATSSPTLVIELIPTRRRATGTVAP